MESSTVETAYRVLARKYRPENFSDLIGQESMVRTLTNAFDTGRIAQAWMLTGVRGVGKTTTARILARALNYQTDVIDRPTIELNEFGMHCQAIMEGRHVDVVEMDAASHTGIDDIREIIEQVRYKPVSARYKVYIIDEVHMLSTQAFNGLLKTLEEPPPHVKFIFATTEIRKVPITVLSRCQRFDLRRIESHTLAQHLRKISDKEHVEAEDKALAMIARAGEGSVRDALSILDQAIAHGDGKVNAIDVRSMLGLADRARIIDLFELIMKGDVRASLNELRSQYDAGADPLVVLNELADFNHMVTRLRFTPEVADDVTLAEEERVRGLDFSQKLSIRVLSRNWQMLLKGMQEVDNSAQPIQAAEMLLIRLAHAADLPTLDETLKAISEGKITGGMAQKSVPAHNNVQAVQQPQQHALQPEKPAPQIAEQPAPIEPHRQISSETRQPINTQSFDKSISPQDVSLNAMSQAYTGEMAKTIELAPTVQLVTQNTMVQKAESLANIDASPVEQLVPTNSENTKTFSSIQDIVDLAAHHNDVHLKLLIKEYVRPILVQNGRIEFEPSEHTPRTLAQDMAKKLREWTGERWTVTVVNEGGGATLREEDDSARAELLSNAEADPDISKILRHFPGSKIVDVRLNKQDDNTMLDLNADAFDGTLDDDIEQGDD